MFLSVKNLSYGVKSKVILKEVNIEVKKGQIVGLLGPSGSGKTSLLKHIVGTLPSHGNIILNKKEVPFPGMYREVGYMLQSDALYEDLSCINNLLFFGRILGVENVKEKAEEIINLCELSNAKKTIVKNMSGGMKRRLSLAIALINDPSFLILDEPTVGIDPVLREKFWIFFRKIRKERNAAIIVTTHIMSDAEECDNLYILSDGIIVASGTDKELKKIANTESMDKAYTILSQRAKKG